MPPVRRQRPDDATYERLAAWLETELDRLQFIGRVAAEELMQLLLAPQ